MKLSKLSKYCTARLVLAAHNLARTLIISINHLHVSKGYKAPDSKPYLVNLSPLRLHLSASLEK